MMQIFDFLFPYILPLLLGGMGYLFVYYFWEPIRLTDHLKEEITITITRYANIRQRSEYRKNHDYNGPGDLYDAVQLNQNEIETATHKLRQLAGELRAMINNKKSYPLLSKLRLVPPKQKIEASAKSLVGWANSFGQENQSKLIGDFINELAKNFEIPIS